MKNDRVFQDQLQISPPRCGTTLPFGKLWVLAGLLALVGCGRQDRLEPVGLESPGEMESTSWGALEDLESPLFWQYRPTAIGAWSKENFVIGMNDGVIIQVTGNEYRRLVLPETEYVYGLVCEPGGGLVVLDGDGRIWNRVADEWIEEENLPGVNYRGMERDALGALWAWSLDGWVYRRDESSTRLVDIADTLDIDDGWFDEAGVGWFVTEDLDVIRVAGDQISVQTLTYPAPNDARKVIAGGPQGELAVCAAGGEGFWYFDGAVWSHPQMPPDPNPSVTDIFWLGEDLHAVLYTEGATARWDGGAWVDVQQLPWPLNRRNYGISAATGGGRLLGLTAGIVVDYYPGPPELRSPPLYPIVAVDLYNDHVVAGCRDGAIFSRQGPYWRLETAVHPDTVRVLDDGLLATEFGLVQFGNESIARWSEGQPPVLLDGHGVRNIHRQSDGTVLFTDADHLFRHDGQVAVPLASFQRIRFPDVVSVTGTDSFRVLDGQVLYSLDSGHEDVAYLMSGWYPSCLLYDASRGLVIAGDGRILLQTESGVEDCSAWRETITGWRRLGITDLCLDGQGGWLAATSDLGALLRREDADWSRLEIAFPYSAEAVGSRLRIQPARDGTFLVFNSRMVARLIPEGAP